MEKKIIYKVKYLIINGLLNMMIKSIKGTQIKEICYFNILKRKMEDL